ncbi:unnamed protein product [Dovyalis caffra]|uniref:Uncharacterized protein n=1 Tax=Dovyalis caffra TaxID=77055 RepID=A0AAV1S6K5_9ROSI|nr:unnamed protein product [Dovyalis caffra]
MIERIKLKTDSRKKERKSGPTVQSKIANLVKKEPIIIENSSGTIAGDPVDGKLRHLHDASDIVKPSATPERQLSP